MRTVMYIDVENMGGRCVRHLVDAIINEYRPIDVIMVHAENARVSADFSKRRTRAWTVHKCQQGQDAADKVIQDAMCLAARRPSVDRIVLVSSDHGFATACQQVVDAGKNLLLVVRQGTRLVKQVAARVHRPFSVLRVGRFCSTTSSSTVFLKTQDGELHEVPFTNGMLLEQFCRMLKAMGLHRRRIVHWLKTCMLVVRDGKVYVDEDACLRTEYRLDLLAQGVAEMPELR